MEKSNLMMIVIIVLLVVLLGTIVAVTVYAFSAVQNLETTMQTGTEFDRTPRTLLPTEIGRIPVGEPITTNLAAPAESSSPGRMARIQVVIGYDNTLGQESDEMAIVLTEQMDYIRSLVLEHIRERTSEELSGREGMNLLSSSILETLQNAFRTNVIVGVYFNEWVIT